jgi:hypothetical protein
LAFGGAFGRASVYAKNAGEDDKQELRKAIRKKVKSLVAAEYTKLSVTSEEHIKNLEAIKAWVDTSYSRVLRNGEIKFGVVQKLVNLFLKYQWCLGRIEEPPHCPFDRTIIERLKLKNPPNWTEMNDVETYKMLVEKAREAAKQQSTADWELDVFARRRTANSVERRRCNT